MLNPGVTPVTFNPPGAFVVDQYHTQPANNTGASAFNQLGCNVQTVTMRDKVDNTAYSEATHKIFTPYNSNTAAVEAEWYAVNGSVRYRVLGNHLTGDSWGRIYQCEFIAKEEQG